MKQVWLIFGLATLAGSAACGSLGEQTDTDSPIVGIIAPQAADTVGGTVSISAQVLDGFGIAKVEFLIDGTVIGEDPIAPYAYPWNTRSSGDGPHSVRVQATDLSGNVGFATISVTVDNTRQ